MAGQLSGFDDGRPTFWPSGDPLYVTREQFERFKAEGMPERFMRVMEVIPTDDEQPQSGESDD